MTSGLTNCSPIHFCGGVVLAGATKDVSSTGDAGGTLKLIVKRTLLHKF